MKRGSSGDAFLKMLDSARRAIPGVSIRTSFIVGFPGETDKDFRELCDFVRAAEFDWMGVFAYSDEDTSKSFALENKVDDETIARRRGTLMAIQKKISARKLHKRVGQRLQVMLEGPSKDTDLIWEARLEGMAPEIDGKVYITEFEGVNEAENLPQPGTMATVEITESNDYDLIARAVKFDRPAARAARRRNCGCAAIGKPVSENPCIPIVSIPSTARKPLQTFRGILSCVAMKRRCPICRKPADSETNADFPFCSERCRLLDLGNWSSEKYVISNPVFDESEEEDSRPSDPDDNDDNKGAHG